MHLDIEHELPPQEGEPPNARTLTEADVAAYRERLEQALPRVQERIAAAAARAGREDHEVTLVGVTKTHPAEAIEASVQVGLVDLGENRVEELTWKRLAFLNCGVRWHLIGHVQSRKSEGVVVGADLFHALDSTRLAGRMGRQLEEKGKELDVLLQVNTSGEDSKGGFSPDELEDSIGSVLETKHLRVRGLMTMAPFVADERVVRRTFIRLRELHDRLLTTTPYKGTELSMGMSSDFELAIEEGSTLVRVGTALFGERT